MQWENIKRIPQKPTERTRVENIPSAVKKFNFAKMFVMVSLQSCSNHLRQVYLWRQKVHLVSQLQELVSLLDSLLWFYNKAAYHSSLHILVLWNISSRCVAFIYAVG